MITAYSTNDCEYT